MRHRLILKLFPAGLEKGNALVALGKILGIKREEIMHAANAPNDWNMLEMAGLPVVMANADEETKKKAGVYYKVE